jgi:hypothetical protein
MPYRPLLTGATNLKSAPQLGYVGLQTEAKLDPLVFKLSVRERCEAVADSP